MLKIWKAIVAARAIDLIWAAPKRTLRIGLLNVALLTGLLLTGLPGLPGAALYAQDAPVDSAELREVREVREMVYGLPAVFETNVGQAGAHVSHLLRAQSFSAAFRPDGFDIAVLRPDPRRRGDAEAAPEGNLIGLTFEKARSARITPGDRAEGAINVLLGTDPRGWQVNIPPFRTLGYTGLYDGVDLAFRHARGGLEFALDLAPGARLDTVRIAVEGAERLALTEAGALAIHTSGGPIELTAPKAVQIRGDRIETLRASFTVHGRTAFGFTVEGRDPEARLFIDPLVTFLSYFGGDGAEGIAGSYSRVGPMRPTPDLKLSPDREQVAISGTTSSFQFPQAGGYGSINGTRNAFAARFGISESGPVLLFSTVIGGSGGDFATGIAPRPTGSAGPASPNPPSGGVFLSGWTDSPDFPTSPQPLHRTREEGGGFLVELGAQGQFVRGTMLGHGRDTYPNAIALDLTGPPRDHAVIVGGGIGFASGVDEAVPGPDASPAGGALSGFVAAVRLSLRSYRYFTYVGGSGFDVVHDVDVLGGSAYAVGTTTSFDLDTGFSFIKQAAHSGTGSGASPTTCVAPPQAATAPSMLHTEFVGGPLNCFDGFMVRLAPTGEPLFLTYDGTGAGNFLHGVAIDRREDALGFVAATGSILTGPQTARVALRRATNAGGLFGPNLAIGTGPSMIGESIALDSDGRAHIVGTVDDPGLATGAGSQLLQGPPHIFYLQVDANASAPVFFTYLGGRRVDFGFGVDVVGNEDDGYCAFVLGETSSPDLPASEAGQPVLDGASDLLLAVVCDGPIRIPPTEFTKQFVPATVTAPNYAANVRFVVQNPTPFPLVVTIFDDLPPGLTFTGGTTGCTATSPSTLRCNVTVPPFSSPPIDVPVVASREQCDVSYRNNARLYAGFFLIEPPFPPLLMAQATFNVRCEPTITIVTECVRNDAGDCLCGIDYGECREDGYFCVFGEVDAGPSWGHLTEMNGICRPEGFAEDDYSAFCRVRYAWWGGQEVLTLDRGETREIEQGEMRYVENFNWRPPVDVRMSGVLVPEFTLISNQRNPMFGNYVPLPSLDPKLPVLHTLHCQRIP